MLFVPNGANAMDSFVSYSGSRPPIAVDLNPAVIPSTTNAYGNWTRFSGSANIAANNNGALLRDAYGLLICAYNTQTGATFRQLVAQIGVDYTGSSAYNPIISELIVGSSSPYGVTAGGVTPFPGRWYYFPMFIPSGSSVAVRGRGSQTTQFNMLLRFLNNPSNPSMVKRAAYVDTYGITLGTGTATGVTLTNPSVTAVPPAWTAIGTLTRRAWWFQVGIQNNDTTMTGGPNYHVDIGYGPDINNVQVLYRDSYFASNTTEGWGNMPITFGAEQIVPSGSTIYVRMINAGNNEANNSYQAAIYAAGG